MSSQSETPNIADDMRTGMNLIWFVSRVWATSLEVFIRAGVGARYPGIHGALVMIFMPAFLLGWPRSDPQPLLMFLATYFAMCVWQRMTVWARSPAERASEHSFYNGYPVVCRMNSTLTEARAKQLVEPILAVGIGYCTSLWNPPLGWYLVGGGICLWLSHAMCSRLRSEELLDVQDSMHEQKQLAERFRETQYDN